MTAPLLFRTLHNRGGTVLLDEAEHLRDNTPDAKEIGSVLRAGYKRGGRASRLEAVGKEFHPKEFEVYGPKALAAINDLPPALVSRCIPILMVRADAKSPKSRKRIDVDERRWIELRDDLHALAVGPLGQNALTLASSEAVCSFSNRHFELWQPLLAIASFVEHHSGGTLEDLTKDVENFARLTIADSQEDQTPTGDEILLRILADKVRGGQSPTPGEILSEAQHGPESELFNRWSPRGVSSRLKRYGFRVHRGGERREYSDITVDSLEAVQQRHGIDLGFTAVSSRPIALNHPAIGKGQREPSRPSRPSSRVSRHIANRPDFQAKTRRFRKRKQPMTV